MACSNTYIASWSPTIDSPDSPNAYPSPHHSHAPLRHSESFPPDARRPPLVVDRSPYNHHHFSNRSPTDGQWRAEPHRRGALPMRPTPEEERYQYSRGRVDTGLPYSHQAKSFNHLSINRDPRLRRGHLPHGAYSPQSQYQPGIATSGTRPIYALRINQILSEHCYFKKCEPGISLEATSSSNANPVTESCQEVPTDILPRYMLSRVPPLFSIVKKPAKVENLSQEEVLKLGETITKLMKATSEISKMASEPSHLESTSMISIKDPKSIKVDPYTSIAEVKEGEVSSDQTPHRLQSSTAETFSPLSSPALSLSSFQMDLDTEPETSSDEEENQPPLVVSVSRNSLHSEDENPQLVLTTCTSELKPAELKLTGINVAQSTIEAEPIKASQPNNRILRNGRVLPHPTSVVYSTRRQPVAVVDNRVPSVRLSLSRDSMRNSVSDPKAAEGSHRQQDGSRGDQQLRTRRSKRLAISQDNVLEHLNDGSVAEQTASSVASSPDDDVVPNFSEVEIGAVEPSPKASTEVKAPVQELSKEERTRLNLEAAQAVKVVKERKRAQRIAGPIKQRTRSVSSILINEPCIDGGECMQ